MIMFYYNNFLYFLKNLKDVNLVYFMNKKVVSSLNTSYHLLYLL